MNGPLLALGSTAALAIAGLVKRGSRSAIPDLSVVTEGQDVRLGDRYVAGGISFDARSDGQGLGAVFSNANVDYEGFAVWMRPSEFLRLNPRLADTETFRERVGGLVAQLAAGVPFGPPFLVLNVLDDGGEPWTFQVRSHEGRHRMAAILAHAGDAAVPVHCFGPSWMRARDLSVEILSRANVMPDKRVGGAKFVVGAFALDGVAHVSG